LRELAYRDADYGGLTEKIDCAPDCGGTADIAISYCPLLASEELETLGLEFTDLQLIAHELGHAFAMFSALVENDPSYVSGEAFNEWSLLFENAVRDDILRGVH